MTTTIKTHTINAAHVPQIRQWFAERGGIAVWVSHNLANPGASWTTPATAPDGGPPPPPTWQAGRTPDRLITDPSEVLVEEVREVRRFRIAIRPGAQGFTLKLTDASTRKLRAAVARAGEGAYHAFDYDTQEAIVFVPVRTIPLPEYTPTPDPRP